MSAVHRGRKQECYKGRPQDFGRDYAKILWYKKIYMGEKVKMQAQKSRTKSRVVTFFAVLGIFAGASLCTAADPAGQKAFMKEKCDRCHAIASLDIEARDKEEEAPDMSNVGATAESADWITKWVLREVTKDDGTKHQKPYEGSKKNLGRISKWLMTLETS